MRLLSAAAVGNVPEVRKLRGVTATTLTVECSCELSVCKKMEFMVPLLHPTWAGEAGLLEVNWLAKRFHLHKTSYFLGRN